MKPLTGRNGNPGVELKPSTQEDTLDDHPKNAVVAGAVSASEEVAELEMKPLTDGHRNPGVELKPSTQEDTLDDHPQKTVVAGVVSPSESLAEMEIRSLLWMEQMGNEVYAKAYRIWMDKVTFYTESSHWYMNQSSSQSNEIYQLIGFYSVFQGVLLTVVAQSNLLHCNNWWSAFFLSLLASMVTVGGVVQKYMTIMMLERSIYNIKRDSRLCIKRVTLLLIKRGSFDFNKDARDGDEQRFSVTRLQLFVALVVLILVVFSGLFLASIYRIVCHP